MTKNVKIGIGVGGIIGAALLAWLAIGVFGIQTLFIDETVSEANPFANQTAALVVDAEPRDAQLAVASTAAEVEPEAVQPAPAQPEAAAVQAETTAPAVSQIVTLAQGSLVDHDHQGEGTVTVLTDGTQRFLRFEDDFAIDNGPDLNVYLVRGADAEGDPGLFDDDFVDLGDLKGNIGAQNYELPADVDLGEYDTVVIWCVRFGVAFNAADLA